MIDFIKLNVSYLSERDLLNKSFAWIQSVNRETGEIKYPITGKYYNLDINLNPKRKEISGSIHKLRNELKTSQNQNYDDFTFDDLKEMVYHIRDVFNLNLDKTIIENLECGLNINTVHAPANILHRNLIVWSDMVPSKNKSFEGKGKFIEFEKSQYSVKIYDKGKQAGQIDHIMRFEFKSIKNEYIRKIGIRTLNDLLHKDKIQLVMNHLYESFSLSVIVDDLSSETITEPRERYIFTRGINPMTWTMFDSDGKGRKAKERFNKALDHILDKYNLNTIKKEIDTKLREKGDHLLKCHKMTDMEKSMDDLSECRKMTEMEVLPDQSNVWSENTEMSQNDTYIYCQNVTSEKCIITGIDISHQTTNKTYLLESSIKEIEPERFIKLEKEFKPKRKYIMKYEDICKEIAHRIRRKYQTLKEKRQRYQNSLFPLEA